LDSLDIPKSVKINLSLEDIKVNCNEHKIEAVFTNLISNSLQSMNEQGQLDIRLNSQDNTVKIEFSDTGKGIPEKNMRHIFEPLYTTKQEGIGLGLSSCKSIIEQHNGKISAKNNPEKGVTFTIVLPLNE